MRSQPPPQDQPPHDAESGAAGPQSGPQSGPEPGRRDILKLGLAGAAAAGAGSCASPGQSKEITDKFLPEEVWRDRMQAPDDGKKFGWVVDTRRCFGCHGCEVACKAENDVPLGNFIRQTIYHDHEVDSGSSVARIMVPMACQHCEDTASATSTGSRGHARSASTWGLTSSRSQTGDSPSHQERMSPEGSGEGTSPAFWASPSRLCRGGLACCRGRTSISTKSAPLKIQARGASGSPSATGTIRYDHPAQAPSRSAGEGRDE